MKHLTALIVLVLAALLVLSCEKSPNPLDSPNSPNPADLGDVQYSAKPNNVQRPPVAPFFPSDENVSRIMKPGVVASTALAAASQVVVDDDGAADFTTIQDAVNSGAKKIIVRPGTYAENVTIGPNAIVNIEGAGIGSTWVTGVAGTAGPIIDVLPGSKVNIKELAVDGGSAMAGSTVYGIRYDQANGAIEDVEVKNIRDASGGAQGVGIRVQSSGTLTKVTVDECVVSNYMRAGINGNGPGVKLTVRESTVSGPVLPRVWAPNGIQISRGAEGTVKSNEIDNNPSPNPPGGAGSGILLFCAGPTLVQGNKVTDADLGIGIADNANGKVMNNEIKDSVFDGISLQFIGLYYGGSLGCDPSVSPTHDNLVQNNKIKNSAYDGISFANYDPASAPTTPSNNRILTNQIEGSGFDGIHVYDGAGNQLSKNRIETSSGTDAVDDTIGGGTAGTANTWTKNKGATSVPAGLVK